MTENALRQELARIAHLMYKKGFVAGTDGNISVRLDNGNILMTPSGVSKGELHAQDLIVIDAEGNKVKGERGPTSERFLHLKAFEMRKDINAVIHAHPRAVVALTLAGVRDIDYFLPETTLYLGNVPVTDYATPTSMQGPEVLTPHLADNEAFILPMHGSVTIGETLLDAFNKLEALEHSCSIMRDAMLLKGGPVEKLDEKEVDRLWDIHKKVAGRDKVRKPLTGQ